MLPEGPVQSEDIAALAQDKTSWNDRSDRLALQNTDDVGYFLPQIWESWQHPLQAAEFAEWYMPVFVVPNQGGLRAVILDRELGVGCLQVDDFVQVCSHCLMLKQVFNVDMLVDPDLQDSVLLELPSVIRAVWLRHSVVVTWSAYPREWSECVQMFSGLS